MKAEIKILDFDKIIGKNGKLVTRLWCVITIDGIKFTRLFYLEHRE